MDILFSMYKHMKLEDKMSGSGSIGKLMETMANPDRVAKMASLSFPIQSQFMRFPPMSASQETVIIRQIEAALQKGKEGIKEVTKQIPKNVKMLTFKNPYPMQPSSMSDLYVGNGECAWESTTDVMPLYKKRQEVIQQIRHTFSQKEKTMKDFKMGNIGTLFSTFYDLMDLLYSLPPGPNKESEQERIAYLTNQNKFFKEMFKLIEGVKKEIKYALQALIRQAKKD